jgi:hypothetical protein
MTVFTITPYRSEDCWVFDAPELGLKGEAFVGGATEALDEVLKDLGIYEEALEDGFTIQARAGDAEGVIRDEDEQYDPYWSLCDVILSRVDNPALQHRNNVLFGMEGTWYATHPHSVRELPEPHVVWLCPALQLFFGGKPKRIYLQVESLSTMRSPRLEEAVLDGTLISAEDASAIDR